MWKWCCKLRQPNPPTRALKSKTNSLSLVWNAATLERVLLSTSFLIESGWKSAMLFAAWTNGSNPHFNTRNYLILDIVVRFYFFYQNLSFQFWAIILIITTMNLNAISYRMASINGNALNCEEISGLEVAMLQRKIQEHLTGTLTLTTPWIWSNVHIWSLTTSCKSVLRLGPAVQDILTYRR